MKSLYTTEQSTTSILVGAVVFMCGPMISERNIQLIVSGVLFKQSVYDIYYFSSSGHGIIQLALVLSNFAVSSDQEYCKCCLAETIVCWCCILCPYIRYCIDMWSLCTRLLQHRYQMSHKTCQNWVVVHQCGDCFWPFP